MNHRRVLSQGNVPFFWEDIPGVSKITHKEYPTDTGLNYNPKFLADDIKIPLPPCPVQPPHRRSSSKVLRQQEDPFLAALKECTKSVRNGKELGGSKNIGFGFNLWKSKFIFLCKGSCEVEDDNLVRLSNLPPLPRERSYGGLVKMRE